MIQLSYPYAGNADSYYKSNSAIEYGDCEVVCELVLAFRSLATAVVFFARREHRSELADVRTLWRRLRARVTMWCLPSKRTTSGVRFRGVMLEEVQMITNDDDNDDDDDDGARERGGGSAEIASLGGDIVAASVPYRPFADETEM